MSNVNKDRGGYKGKNFNPNHKSIHHGPRKGSDSASGHGNSSGDTNRTDQPGGRVNRGGYKGKNFDPNYRKRFAKLKDLFDPIAELRDSRLPPRPDVANTIDHNGIRNVPTGPRSQRQTNRGTQGQRRDSSQADRYEQQQHQDRYHHRRRKLDQDADQWMCSCPTVPTRCHAELLRQYEDDCRAYRTQLAACEHAVEVLLRTLESFAQANGPEIQMRLAACYEAVEREVIEQEYAYFREESVPPVVNYTSTSKAPDEGAGENKESSIAARTHDSDFQHHRI
jgi:hypothetical protein